MSTTRGIWYFYRNQNKSSPVDLFLVNKDELVLAHYDCHYKGMFRLDSTNVLTVLDLCFDRARLMLRLCLTYVSTFSTKVGYFLNFSTYVLTFSTYVSTKNGYISTFLGQNLECFDCAGICFDYLDLLFNFLPVIWFVPTLCST